MHARTHRHTHTHTTQYPDTLPRTPHSHRAPGKIADTGEEQGACWEAEPRGEGFSRGAGSSLRSGGGALGQRRVRARGRVCRAVRAWRGQPRSRKWPLTRGTEQGLPRLGSPLQSNSRRSPEERQAAAAARRSAVRSPQPCCLAFPHSISCHCNANPVTRYRLASPSRERRKRRRRKRRSGARGTGVGRKGREEGEEGGEGPAGRRVCVWSSLRHQPQLPPLPPPPLFSKIALSAPPAKRGLRPAAPIPGAESRVQAPPLAREGESQAETGSHTRLRLPTGTARVLFASALPPPGGGMGAVGTGGSLEEGAAEGVPRLC